MKTNEILNERAKLYEVVAAEAAKQAVRFRTEDLVEALSVREEDFEEVTLEALEAQIARYRARNERDG